MKTRISLFIGVSGMCGLCIVISIIVIYLSGICGKPSLFQMIGMMIVIFSVCMPLIIFVTLSLFTALIRPIHKINNDFNGVIRSTAEKWEMTLDLPNLPAISSRDEIDKLNSSFKQAISAVNHVCQIHRESEKRYQRLFADLKKAVDSKDYSMLIEPESEDDHIALSLNRMLKTLKTSAIESKNQNWLKTGQTELNDVITGEQRIDVLCRKTLSFIAEYLNAQVGTFYITDEEDSETLIIIANYAFHERKYLPNRLKLGQGLVGQVGVEKKRIMFFDIPEDYIMIQSGLGNCVPENILIFPLIYEGNLKGVIELGSIYRFSDLHIEFTDTVASRIAVAINSVQANSKLKTLLDKTRKQAEELQQQQEELRQVNEELEEQTRILKASEAKLQQQQEELQVTNEEMEEKNRMLEQQKNEIESNNTFLEKKQREIEEKAHELELATRYKSEFLANMSHELRTPLNSMLLLANMLSENEENNLLPDQIESVRAIYRSGKNLLVLINDILDLSKIEARKIELSIEKFSPKVLITDIESEFRPIAKERQLQFSIFTSDKFPEFITTDRHRLGQIIRNLLSNAFKFTENGSITLEFNRPDTSFISKILNAQNTIAISVSDTGIGIPDDKQRLIFEAFHQVNGSVSRRYGGTGLGLSISKELVHILGGEIHIKSTENVGTTFTIYLPEHYSSVQKESDQFSLVSVQRESGQLSVVSDQKESDELSVVSVQKESGQLSVVSVQKTTDNFPVGGRIMLIIEDDPEFSRILNNFSKERNFECLIAKNGETGIKYAIKHRPAAIILDIALPGISGWVVLEELKNNPDTRHIPVHIISAHDRKREGLQKGAMGYLTKPVTKDQLVQAFERIENFVSATIRELLIVEKSEELKNSVSQLLKSVDVRITTANTGMEAYEQIQSNNFNCVILDLDLPDISGVELLEKIAANEKISNTPIIIYSGRDLTEAENEKLKNYTASIILKSDASMERLLDEMALFLHQVETDLPPDQQKIIRKLHDKESVLRGKKAMIVDDDMRNAFALSKFLRSRGMTVFIASNGEKALSLLEEYPDTDIILMDIMMPVMDGYDTMKHIRAKEQFKNLPILALTAKAMESDRKKCIECGANDYMSKPVDVSKLLSMLRVWLY